MADYVSNCPVSWPVKLDWVADWDIGGMSWSYLNGMFFEPPEISQNMRLPTTQYTVRRKP